MNLKGVLVISGIIITIVAMAVLSSSDLNDISNVPAPSIIDKSTVADESKIRLDSTISDAPTVSDFAEETIDEKSDVVNFWIDEDGVKHYILEVIDEPTLKEN